MDDLDITRLNDASAMLFTNLLLMNTILCPIVLAALASRMCDMEQMGNTYKWICTMQKPEHVYRGKAAAGSFISSCLHSCRHSCSGLFHGHMAEGPRPI